MDSSKATGNEGWIEGGPFPYDGTMDTPNLLEFLSTRMAMTDVYQPVIIRELLLNNGTRTKAELATALAGYDLAVQEYYERIVMRWPKITLAKHGIVRYERNGTLFRLLPYLESVDARLEAIRLCDAKIDAYLERKKSRDPAPKAGASVRYEVLRGAKGKCQLCGISAEIRPIDIDHIVPQSKADKNGKVRLNGKTLNVNDPQNLQALCFACNRGKRASDQTDFRKKNKLVRDKIPDLISAEGRAPKLKRLSGRSLVTALYDKLAEEHAELLAAADADSLREELADMVEVLFAIAYHYGLTEDDLMNNVHDKREHRGGFKEGYYRLDAG